MSNLCIVRFVVYQQHFKLLDIVDEELVEATGHHVLCFLVAPITSVGPQDLALEFSVYPLVNASGFPPAALNFDILVGLVLDELLGPLFNNLELH